MTKIEGLDDFIYERSESRSFFRAGSHYDLADDDKGYLEELGVIIKDHSKEKSTYEFQGKVWTITITHK